MELTKTLTGYYVSISRREQTYPGTHVTSSMRSRRRSTVDRESRSAGKLQARPFKNGQSPRNNGALRRPLEPKQYASRDYRKALRQYGMRASMSHKGDCFDNAVAESFFATLKKELIYGRVYITRREADLLGEFRASAI